MGFIKHLLLYKYYDTPEGEDCFYKIFYLAKWSAVTGVAVAYYDIIAYRHLIPKNSGPAGFFLRGLRTVGPVTACGAFFGAAACLASSFRKKEDHLNYVFAAAGTGALLGCFMRSTSYGAAAATILSCAAFLKKDSRFGNWHFFPDPELISKYRHESNTLYLRELDFSLIKDWQPKQRTYYFPGSIDPLPALPQSSSTSKQ